MHKVNVNGQGQIDRSVGILRACRAEVGDALQIGSREVNEYVKHAPVFLLEEYDTAITAIDEDEGYYPLYNAIS